MEQLNGRMATWLEMAVAPQWHRDNAKIRIHPVGGHDGGCFALSMNGRWLSGSGGRLTVFRGIGSAIRFLKVIHIADFEGGEATGVGVSCGDHAHCLSSTQGRGLEPCPRACAAKAKFPH